MKKKLFFAGMISLALMFKMISCSSSPGSSTSKSKGTGIYIGIISFGADAEDITGGAPIYLDGRGYTNLQDILDTKYGQTNTQGTALFYAVHKGLANLSASVSKLPSPLNSVNILTFTDGLDNNSTSLRLRTLEGRAFGGKSISEYQQYVKTQISVRTIKSAGITAYSAGVKGNDVSDPAGFTTALKSLASTDQNFYELSNFSQLNDKFAEIAGKLTVITNTINFNVLTPSYPVGTRVRMTFDIDKNDTPDYSQRYLQGEVTIRNGKYVLTNIDDYGMTAAVGTNIIGTLTGTEVTYLFTGLQGYYPNQQRYPVLQWSMAPGSTVWQRNSEYAVGNAAYETTEKKSAVIYLVLDASNSLSSDDVDSIREAAKGFIQTLYQKTADSGGRKVVAGVPQFIKDALKNAPEDALIGIGTAKMATLNMSRTIASTRARAEISRQMNSMVRDMVRDYTAASEVDPEAAFSFQEVMTVALSESKLQGAGVIEEDMDEAGNYWVVVQLDKIATVIEINQAQAAAKLKAPVMYGFNTEARINDAFNKQKNTEIGFSSTDAPAPYYPE